MKQVNYQLFSCMDWVYPDTEITCPDREAVLSIAKNSDDCFQLLTDQVVKTGCPIHFNVDCPFGSLEFYQLLPAHVDENCGKELFTTLSYDEVKTFVTRKAPFDVYDITRPIYDGKLIGGRLALFIRVNISKEATPGSYHSMVEITIGSENSYSVPLTVNVVPICIPDHKDAHLSMTNWLFCENIAKQHGVSMSSVEYDMILKKYIQNLVDMRNTHLMLPMGEPITDDDGNVIDFDFSFAERVGKIALESGIQKVMGGFSVKWKKWTDRELYLKWDMNRDTSTECAKRELSIYYRRAYESVVKNHWQDCYLQCVLDEVEESNYETYKEVIRIVREKMPNVKVHDPVEDFRAEDCVDIFVAKQVRYEERLAEYQRLQNNGKEVWVYTCAFPGGNAMKRIMDLPLVTTRLPIWLCYRYNLSGFLCWGYNVHTDQIERSTCLPVEDGNKLMAGDGFIVYPGDNGMPWYSVRGHIQRMAMYDYELLYELGSFDQKRTLKYIEKMCRSFTDYERSATVFDQTRLKILNDLALRNKKEYLKRSGE